MLEDLRRIEQLESQISEEKQKLGAKLRRSFESLYNLACQKVEGKDLFRGFYSDDFKEQELLFPANAFLRYPGFDNLPPSVKFHLRQEYGLISLGEEDRKEFFDVIFGLPTKKADFYYIDINHKRIGVSLKGDRVVPSVAIIDEEKSETSLAWNQGWAYTEVSSDNEAYLWTIQILDLVGWMLNNVPHGYTGKSESGRPKARWDTMPKL